MVRKAALLCAPFKIVQLSGYLESEAKSFQLLTVYGYVVKLWKSDKNRIFSNF
jgi:hypothetical protein